MKTPLTRARLLGLIAALLLAGCGPTEMHELEIRGGLYYKKGESSPYSGPAVAYFPTRDEDDDKKIYKEAFFANGKPDGTWVTYFHNGGRKEVKYAFGKINGQVRVFDARSKVREETTYVNGRRHGGQTAFNKEGKPVENHFYKDNIRRPYLQPGERTEFKESVKAEMEATAMENQ
ncbi:toxin-antitoxin system YwqK family antitoxin [Magnetofaba australis]|uniref:MORN repeat-containing protein n=1 Tax=Magnetofaba australis IT-1 TaxID=1434232 RepID=A0A1Y2K0N0_9PROT|nr:hypothetical protein [Magnetofaba australis]OSM01529.1 hypothetical protein MAIT1_01519 [Magnetofaba australis IT-1]